jgi:hypothetical protein
VSSSGELSGGGFWVSDFVEFLAPRFFRVRILARGGSLKPSVGLVSSSWLSLMARAEMQFLHRVW